MKSHSTAKKSARRLRDKRALSHERKQELRNERAQSRKNRFKFIPDGEWASQDAKAFIEEEKKRKPSYMTIDPE